MVPGTNNTARRQGVAEREQILQMFVIAILVSVGLSLVLASTIANPLSDLAAAAEIGRERNARTVAPGRVTTDNRTIDADEVIVAAGGWTDDLLGRKR